MTKSELAAKLGLSRITIDQYLSMPGAPKESKDGFQASDVERFIGFVAAPKTIHECRQTTAQIKIRQSELKIQHSELKRKIANGELLAKAALGPAITDLFLRFRLEIQREFEDELPAKLVGMSESESAAEMRRALDRVFAMLDRGIDQLLVRN